MWMRGSRFLERFWEGLLGRCLLRGVSSQLETFYFMGLVRVGC